MPSPFPGMDPYLENRDLWPNFNNAFAAQICGTLNRTLPDGYLAKNDYRFETQIPPDDDDGGCERLLGDPVKVAFVEIREAAEPHVLVTVMTLIGPSNKHHSHDRTAYSEMQRLVLNSDASLVEIDLLRQGERVLPSPLLEAEIRHIQPPPDYLVMVSPSWKRDPQYWGYTFYPIGIRAMLPCIAVPLKHDDIRLPLDLQEIFNRVYDAGAYRRGAVNYKKPMHPPLAEDDAAWASTRLAS